MNTEFPTRWCGMAQSWMLGNVARQHLLLVLVMYWVNSGWTNSSLAVGLSVFFCSRHLKRISLIGGERLSGIGGGCIDVAICRGKMYLHVNVLSKSVRCTIKIYCFSLSYIFWKNKRRMKTCYLAIADWLLKKRGMVSLIAFTLIVFTLIVFTLNMSARWFEISFAFQGGLVVVISIMTHPTLHTSQALP